MVFWSLKIRIPNNYQIHINFFYQNIHYSNLKKDIPTLFYIFINVFLICNQENNQKQI